MKPSIAITLGAGAFAVMLSAYLVSYATTVRDPVEWKSGDLIVQDATVEHILPLFTADGSGVTHIGIVDKKDDGAVVIEAADTVRETPIQEFLARGKNKEFAVYRIPHLSDEQAKAVVAAARRQLGKPNDFFLSRSWDGLYSSELVRLAYSDIGFDLGRVQKLASVAGDLTTVKSQFSRSWSSNVDCTKRNFSQDQCWAMMAKQEVITPSSIVGDTHVTKIYSTIGQQTAKGFTFSRAEEAKKETPTQ